MGMLMTCSVCCLLLSVWGVIQLFVMGILYKVESVILVSDAFPPEYEDYDDFIKLTKKNYVKIAYNCWICSAIYLLLSFISYGCYRKAKNDAQLKVQKWESDVPVLHPKKTKKKLCVIL